MKALTTSKEWQDLSHHYKILAPQQMRDWFNEDAERFNRFTLSAAGIFLDYSRNRINSETLKLLFQLAESTNLREKIVHLFTGHPINRSEMRPALHTALRDQNQTTAFEDSTISTLIQENQATLRQFVTAIHDQTWKGCTGKPIKHVVNIGIGGSFTGPMMCCDALKSFAQTNIQFHFISSVDETHLKEVWNRLDPASTLFIISSKSFTTIETLTNANTILHWMQSALGNKPEVLASHFIAVTAKPEKASAFGISKENIFLIWDWVGGRYSIWSAIGLPLRLLIGNDGFDEFLAGAYNMDEHFKSAPFAENMPVLLALLEIWYVNFFGANTTAVIPYSHRLRYLIPYLQQAQMESNGKTVSLDGHDLSYQTSPVLFGEEGVIGQHTYHQLLHQGQHLIPADFIIVAKSPTDDNRHHPILIASALSQAEALMRGKTYEEALLEINQTSALNATELAKHTHITGNKPSNILLLNELTPRNLGALLALYEHKIFVEGVIWNINSFDQWGVELGKQLLPTILKQLQETNSKEARIGLIDYLKNIGLARPCDGD